ncbi:MAG: tRNA 2-thiouridine(34) synthase MnmA [Hydrogenobaculum sp.]
MRIAVGMSGGVDSSVAAYLLKEQGHDVIGVTLRFYKEECPENARVCCSPKDVQDARIVCDILGIPHITLDWENLFKERVIDYFIKSYKAGLTPNPCAICNKDVKTAFLGFYLKQTADIDFLATGHYVIKEGNKIKRAKEKDQSYFMALVPKQSLDYLIFPVGLMTKQEIRDIAKKINLPVANKVESQDVCFLKGMDLEDYLSQFIYMTQGDIVHIATQNKLGKHKGIHKYTIGQRHGLGVSYHKPLYVVEKDIENNILYVGEKEYLFKDAITLKDYNRLENFEKDNMYIQIRYNSKPIPIKHIEEDKDDVRVLLKEPATQVAKGQVGAIYFGDTLLGGGIIS